MTIKAREHRIWVNKSWTWVSLYAKIILFSQSRPWPAKRNVKCFRAQPSLHLSQATKCCGLVHGLERKTGLVHVSHKHKILRDFLFFLLKLTKSLTMFGNLRRIFADRNKICWNGSLWTMGKVQFETNFIFCWQHRKFWTKWLNLNWSLPVFQGFVAYNFSGWNFKSVKSKK